MQDRYAKRTRWAMVCRAPPPTAIPPWFRGATLPAATEWQGCNRAPAIRKDGHRVSLARVEQIESEREVACRGIIDASDIPVGVAAALTGVACAGSAGTRVHERGQRQWRCQERKVSYQIRSSIHSAPNGGNCPTTAPLIDAISCPFRTSPSGQSTGADDRLNNPATDCLS